MAVKELEIHGAVTIGGTVYVAGDEEELARVMTEDQARYLRSRDVISCRIPRGGSSGGDDDGAGGGAEEPTEPETDEGDEQEGEDEEEDGDDGEGDGDDEEDEESPVTPISQIDLDQVPADAEWSRFGWDMEGYSPPGYLSRYGTEAVNSQKAIRAIQRYVVEQES